MNFGGRLERQLSRSQAYPWETSLREKIHLWMHDWENLQFRYKVEILVLKPLDLANTAWLVYIVLAQTFGWYRTCKCQSSIWAGEGGYLDFESIESYKAHGIVLYWGSGTALSLVILSVAVLFIIAEWCSQSHLSTMDYSSASRGLKRTRWWKLHTIWLRRAPNAIIEGVVVLCWAIVGLITKKKRARHGRRSIIWSADKKERRRAPAIFVNGLPVATADDGEDVDLLSRGRLHERDISLRTIERPSPSHSRVFPARSSIDFHSNSEYEPL
jgi:hypothetical protein